MGKLNMKLMQGIEATEHQIQTQKQDKMSQSVPERTETGKLPESHQKFQTAHEQTKNTKKSKINKNKPDTRSQKQVFSFRATVGDINIWRAYATASSKKIEYIGVAAMNEYLKKHKLTGAEQAVFEALMAREEDRE